MSAIEKQTRNGALFFVDKQIWYLIGSSNEMYDTAIDRHRKSSISI
jgi:hypothetical protein